jgi:hypothetical protein
MSPVGRHMSVTVLLFLDEEAERPGIIGMYERGPTAVPVLWDARELKR